MASPSRKRARTESDGGGEEGGEPVAVAAGFEAPIFGARVVGQVTTLALEGEDGPLASLSLRGVAIDHAGGWYVTTKNSVLHVLPAGRVRTVATCEGGGISGVAISPDGSALFVADTFSHKIRRVAVATGAVTTLAGSGTSGNADGVGGTAQFHNPLGSAARCWFARKTVASARFACRRLLRLPPSRRLWCRPRPWWQTSERCGATPLSPPA